MATSPSFQIKQQHEENQSARGKRLQGTREGVGLGADVMSLQRGAGNSSVNSLINSFGEDRTRPKRPPTLVDSTIDSVPLEDAIKSLPNISQNQALEVLSRYQQFIAIRITTGEGRIREAISLRAESFSNYLIGGTIEVFGGTSLPSDDWVEPWRHVNAAYSTLSKRQVKESLASLNSAAEETNRRWGQLNAYLEQTEKGADRSIVSLQVLQAAGAVAATALTGGGVTAIAVGAGYGAAQNIAGQATAVSIGIQSRIDWVGVAFDTFFGVLTGALGGKLGNTVLKKLMGNKAVASLGRRVVSEVISDLVSGRLSSILQTTARSLFDQLRGKEDLTVEQFLELLSDQLLDPKAMLLDVIMGRASKIAHRPSSKIQEKFAPKSRATVTEPPAKSTVNPASKLPASKSPVEPVQTTKPVLAKAVESDVPEVSTANPIERASVKPIETVKTPEASSHKAATSEIAHPAAAKEPALPHELTPTPVVQESAQSFGTKEPPMVTSPGSEEGSGLELDLSGNREGWNKHIDEYHVTEAAKLSAETRKPGFGDASTEKGGTEHHTGMSFHEYSAAEVAIGLRVDWDPQAGRPRKVSYNFTAEAASVRSQATDRSFHQETRLKGESAQSREKAYLKSGKEKGHLAQREAGKVDANVDAALGLKKPTGPEVERSVDVLTNVAPMTPTLNKGNPWRSAETRTAQYAVREGYVTVEITPIYDPKPIRLSDGTPIPTKFRRMIKSGPTGKILEDITFDNK